MDDHRRARRLLRLAPWGHQGSMFNNNAANAAAGTSSMNSIFCNEVDWISSNPRYGRRANLPFVFLTRRKRLSRMRELIITELEWCVAAYAASDSRDALEHSEQLAGATKLLERGSEAMRSADRRLAEAGELYAIACFDRDNWKRRAENNEKASTQREEHVKTLEAAADELERRIAILEPLAKAYREIGDEWHPWITHYCMANPMGPHRKVSVELGALLDRAAEFAKKEGKNG